MRCSRRASNVCGRLEDDRVAICCGTRALFSPVRDQGVGFWSDVFSCDGPIASRLSLCHHSDRESEGGRSSVSSQLCLFFFGHLPIQTNIFAYGLACDQNLIRGLTCCRVFSSFLWVNNSEIFYLPANAKRSLALMAATAGTLGMFGTTQPYCSLPPFATIPQSYAWIPVNLRSIGALA